MKSLLITGSSGYLGSVFIETFDDDYKIFKFSLLKMKLDTLKLEHINVILHFAALVHQKKVKAYEDYFKINTEYPVELARKAKKSGVGHFIYISSVAVYGDKRSLVREATACNPVTPYGKSKLVAENELLKLGDDNFTVSILRPPMIYGRNAPGNIALLIKLIKMAIILPLGGINNKRSFVYVGNLVALINQIIQKRQSGIFLAADDEPLSTTQLINLISKGMKKNVALVNIPAFSLLLQKLKPSLHNKLYRNFEIDDSFTKSVLDYRNPYTVEEGMRYMTKF